MLRRYGEEYKSHARFRLQDFSSLGAQKGTAAAEAASEHAVRTDCEDPLEEMLVRRHLRRSAPVEKGAFEQEETR